MRVIYSNQHQLHHPNWEIFNGLQTPHQEVPARAENIQATLQKVGHSFEAPTLTVPHELLAEVHQAEYLAFLKSATQSLTQNDARYPSVFQYRTGHFSENGLAQLGYYSYDLYTPLATSTWSVALESASCAYHGAQVIQSTTERAVYALCRPPGHHAEFNQMGGYCYLNNAALAAQFLSHYGRVATLDVDFHHGNGTQHLFYRRNDIFTTSLHAHPNWKFPYFSGYEHEVGEEEGEGYNINRCLEAGTTNQQFNSTLEEVLNEISNFKPKYLVLSLGVDTHVSDPIGGFALTTEYFTTMARTICQLGLPTVIVQEGGYNTSQLGENVAAFLQGFE